MTSLSSQSTSLPLRSVQALELTPAIQAKLDARQPSATDAKFGMEQVMQLHSDGDEMQPPLYPYNDGQRKNPGNVSIKKSFLSIVTLWYTQQKCTLIIILFGFPQNW